jgi:hypothetical protein
MSAPIYSVRDGVIPAIVPSVPINEGHWNLVEKLCDLLDTEEMIGPSPAEQAAQLIANSEAQAVVAAHAVTAVYAERDQLRAELARLDAEKPWLKEANATNADLRAEAERLRECCDKTAMLCGKFVTEDDGTDLTPNPVRIASALQRLTARAERAEAEIKDRAAMMRDVMRERDAAEAELAAERARLDWLEDHGWVTGEPCDRAGIDAAMKEGAK